MFLLLGIMWCFSIRVFQYCSGALILALSSGGIPVLRVFGRKVRCRKRGGNWAKVRFGV